MISTKNRFDWFDTVSILFTMTVVSYELSMINLLYGLFEVKRKEMSGVCCHES